MSGLQQRLHYKNSRITEILGMLSRTDRPVGLCGAGMYAGILSEKLPEYGVKPQFIVLEEKYISSVGSNAYGLPVISTRECAEKYPDSYIIIAHIYNYENEWSVVKRTQQLLTPDNEIITLGAVWLSSLDFMDSSYVKENISLFEETYDCLEDSLSKRVMAEYLNARMSGDASVLHLFNTDTSADYEMPLIFSHQGEGVIAECGGYDGKSALKLDTYGKSGHRIYAFEPSREAYDILCRNTSECASVTPVMLGISDSEGTASISGFGGTASLSDNDSSHSDTIKLTTLDSFFKNEKVYAIIMDIEGSELAALRGAAEIISRDRPVLAIRVYHRYDDLIEIPRYLRSFFDDNKYKLFLRINNPDIGIYDVTLYAV